jgi:ATPase subunit of ABC transporter with duplicated ATPase domains
MQSAFVSNEKVAFGEDKQLLKFQFPAAPPLKEGPLITLDNCAFEYSPGALVLQKLTLGVSSGSRVAIVGRNGSGKSTLVKLLAEDLPVHPKALGTGPADKLPGKYSRQAGLQVAYVAQHHVEQLAAFLEASPVQ